MKHWWKNGIASVILRVFIMDTGSTTGAGKTGLTSASSGLVIATIANNEAAPTVYSAAGSTIETITTLGTFAAPTATKCRFKEVDSTNLPGWYEVQIADARWAVSNARSLDGMILGASGAAPCPFSVQLVAVDPQDVVKFGMTRVVANVDQIEGTDATDALDARIAAAGLATASALATAQTSLNTIAGYIDTEVAAILAAVDTEVAAIKAKTDNLPSDPADASDLAALIATAQASLNTIAGYTDSLEASAASLAAAIATVQGYTDQVEGYTDTLETAVAALPTAAGINTVLTAAHGSGAWTTGTSSDPEAIRDAVWGTTDGTRTVTQTAAQVADAIDGEDLTVHRGDTFSATINPLPVSIPSDWTKLTFTAKRGLSDADTASIVQIVLTNPGAGTDGLKYLEGAAPVSPVVAADAALTVNSLTSLTITMKPRATKGLGIGSGWFYDVQADYGAASNSTTVAAGSFAVDADVTRTAPA